MDRKILNFKVYNASGSYLTTWDNEITYEDLVITNSINAGMSAIELKLLRKFNDFDEGGEVNYNNEIKIYLRDTEENSLLIYDGYISGYAPIVEGEQEYIAITILPYSTEFSRFLLRNTDSGNKTTITFNSYDPADILKQILDYYIADGGKVGYTDNVTIEDTGNTVSYTFNTQTALEAIEKCRKLSPNGWYWYVGADKKLYFKPKANDAIHYFYLGGNILEIKNEKRIEKMINRIYFTGGVTGDSESPLYWVYDRASSIAAYGLYAYSQVDGRVTQAATAQTMAEALLDGNDSPEARFIIKIADSNSSIDGYDIEDIKPGDTCKILNYADQEYTRWDQFYWDQDVWDYNIADVAATILQIVSVEWHLDYAVLEVTNRLPQVTHRIEDINRNLVADQTKNNPVAPT